MAKKKERENGAIRDILTICADQIKMDMSLAEANFFSEVLMQYYHYKRRLETGDDYY